jgi:hypothetical protein
LKLLFIEYEKALKNFGVRPAPLPTDIGIYDLMDWIDTEYKALPGAFLVLVILLWPSQSKVF